MGVRPLSYAARARIARGRLRTRDGSARSGRYQSGETAMEWLVWTGAAVSLVGLAGLVWCILKVWKARKAGLPDDELRKAVQKVVPLNTGALLLSVMGLMLVVVGIMLG
jgi:hypothetical protein